MKIQGKYKVMIQSDQKSRLKAQENLSKGLQALPLGSLGSIKVIKE